MKKTVVLLLSAALLTTSCGTYMGAGASVGSGIGAVLGSAIGGITGGPRGSDIGTLVGMASGAAVGAAIGAQADNIANAPSQTYMTNRANGQVMTRSSNIPDNSGYDPTGSGDDTLYDFNGSAYTGNYSASTPTAVDNHVAVVNTRSHDGLTSTVPIEISNARFVDDNQDFVLSPDEFSKVIFEIYNNTENTLYDIQPVVEETTGNKQISISNSIHVEKIEPQDGVRYTAMVKTGSKLKNGTACFRIYAVQGNGTVVSNISEFKVVTSKK